jgi:hypothetical protein
MTRIQWSPLVSTALSLVIVIGCSEGVTRQSLVGPSPLADTQSTQSMSASPWNTWNVAPADTPTNTSPPGNTTPPAPGSGKKARGEGVIGAITGDCPELTLIITGTRVFTTATTAYVNGSCQLLRPGTKVTIDGELFPGGSATAERIEVRGIPGQQRVSGDGVVGQVSGSCPTLTMSVRGVKVTTTGATTFTEGNCEDIRSGTHIDVTGDYDGSEVAATEVKIRRKR